jgi:tRNA(Ile)-lysidine synthetase-like protein
VSVNKQIGTSIASGRYVLAVSGGVDSMVLLDSLRRRSALELIVAHFDHGIRPDSVEDGKLIQSICMSHNIKYVSERVELGEGASEETARQARYNFLRRICERYSALAIVTAHHYDDLLETAIINLMRGTGRYGLSSLASHPALLRPLLSVSKAEIVAYARTNGVRWREDTTNADQTYLRNYVRNVVLARASQIDKEKLHSIIVRHSSVNAAIDSELDQWLDTYSMQASRSTALPCYPLTLMSRRVAYELLQHTFRKRIGKRVERQVAEKALLFVKTARPGQLFTINATWCLRLLSEKDLHINELSRRWVIVEPQGSVLS